MKHKWRWISLLAVVVIAIAVGAASGGANQTPPSGRSAVVSSSHNDSGSADGQMIAAHQQMTEQMRVNDTPAMVQIMNRDPMWQMMRDAGDIAQQDEHQREINVMLGLGG